jgi:hypothetical protein
VVTAFNQKQLSLNNVGCKAKIHFGNKKEKYLTAKIDELGNTVR